MGAKILVLCGPTASGKTALAVALAQRFHGEVVSADSMQVYRGMDIGTAKPTPEERGGIPHHMMDVADPEEPYSVARYVEQAIPVVDGILARGKLPILAGGTGLYIDHLIAGRQFAPFPADSGLRQALQRRAEEAGLSALRQQLAQVDPESAQRLHPNDAKRIIRALEVYLSTGKTISQHNRDSQAVPSRYTPVTIALNYQNRADLWARIDQRVDLMMEEGLLDEVCYLKERGVRKDSTAMQGLGYKELYEYLEGRYPLDEAVRIIKRDTRHFAKRQLTWFKRERDVIWADKSVIGQEEEKLADYMLGCLREKEII